MADTPDRGAVELGRRLRHCRETRNQTREQVAVAVDRSASAVAMWELGYSSPPHRVMEALWDHWGLTPSEFYDAVLPDQEVSA